jgi:hypothetical protein
MTYKTNIADKYIRAWKRLNPEYKIDFSLDDNCVEFLNNEFGKNYGELFKKIPKGMYKADFWRLCKLYLNGGVYADVDLVPRIPINNIIKDRHTFYTCIAVNNSSCFQAFIITTPRNPLILSCIFSFIENKPWNRVNGPTFDMYNTLQKCLNVRHSLQPNTPYRRNAIPVDINIGNSTENIKEINLHFNFPKNTRVVLFPHNYSDEFDFSFNNKKLIVKRTDKNCGWGHHHRVRLIVISKQSVMFFKEIIPKGGKIVDAYVVYKNMRILNSRYASYLNARNRGEKWS